MEDQDAEIQQLRSLVEKQTGEIAILKVVIKNFYLYLGPEKTKEALGENYERYIS